MLCIHLTLTVYGKGNSPVLSTMRTSVTKQTPKPSLPTPNARHLELRPATLSSQKAKPAAGSQTSFASKSKPPSNSLDCNHIFHPHTHNRPFSCFLTPITIQLPLLTDTPVLPLTPPAPEPRRSPLAAGMLAFPKPQTLLSPGPATY